MHEQLRSKALDLALEGMTEAAAAKALNALFPSEPKAVGLALQYAYHGHEALHAAKAQHNKAKARKTMIMLKVNYKEAGEDAVTDCLTDLQHYCMAKGIDYLTCEERAQGHFVTETTGDGDE